MADDRFTLRVPPDKSVKISKWKVKDGVFISRGQVVLLYTVVGEEETRKLKAREAGTVDSLLAKEGDTVEGDSSVMRLEPCRHAAAVHGLCAACGGAAEVAAAAGVPVLHAAPEVRVSAAEARRIGKEDTKRLLAARRLALLLDLDQTLVHTTDRDVPVNLKDVHHFRLRGQPPQPQRWYHTRIRPFTETFLKNMSELFELHVCTFGARTYAHSVSRLLDPSENLFHQRILSRDECFDARAKAANLKALFPCGDSLVCIVDDREDVWLHAPNLVHVKPYVYFPNTADIHSPTGPPPRDNLRDPKVITQEKDTEQRVTNEANTLNNIETEGPTANTDEKDANKVGIQEKLGITGDVPLNVSTDVPSTSGVWKMTEDGMIEMEDSDDYLLYLEDILKRIHTQFYELYDKDNDTVPDLKSVVPMVRSSALQGLSLAFSGLVPRQRSLEGSRVARVAESLGARVLPDADDMDATHLVAARAGTVKVNRARRRHPPIHLVTPAWLWACAERWERVDEQCYPLPLDPHLQSHERKPPAHCSPPHASLSAEWRLSSESAPLKPAPVPETFMDSLNPLLSFSRDDIANMDKEVEDIFNESDESDSESKDKRLQNLNSLAAKESSSSDSESEGSKAKRSRREEAPGKEKPSKEPPAKEAVSDEEEEGGGGESDAEWSDMGAALEREFLSLQQH